MFLNIGNAFLCIGKWLGSYGCKYEVLLANEAAETMAFVLGSPRGFQKWKHLEPVTSQASGFNLQFLSVFTK